MSLLINQRLLLSIWFLHDARSPFNKTFSLDKRIRGRRKTLGLTRRMPLMLTLSADLARQRVSLRHRFLFKRRFLLRRTSGRFKIPGREGASVLIARLLALRDTCSLSSLLVRTSLDRGSLCDTDPCSRDIFSCAELQVGSRFLVVRGLLCS